MNQISSTVETLSQFMMTKAPGLFMILMFAGMIWIFNEMSTNQKAINELQTNDKVFEVKLNVLQEDVQELKQDMKEVKKDILDIKLQMKEMDAKIDLILKKLH